MMYVTIDQAKTHLRVDTDADDLDIRLKIQAASSAVKNYLKSASPFEPIRDANDDPFYDSNDELEVALDDNSASIVKYEVQAAVLIMVGEWYKNREAGQDGGMGMGYLPEPVIALLYPIRDPALA